MKISNPTKDCVVKHNINGTIYEIAPGKTAEVKDSDGPELLKSLGFLIVGSLKDEIVSVPDNEKGEVELRETTMKEVVAREAGKPKKFVCENLVVIKDANGRKEKKKCGFETTRKLALVSHIKNEHPKGKLSESSEVAVESTNDDLKPLKEDLK